MDSAKKKINTTQENIYINIGKKLKEEEKIKSKMRKTVYWGLNK